MLKQKFLLCSNLVYSGRKAQLHFTYYNVQRTTSERLQILGVGRSAREPYRNKIFRVIVTCGTNMIYCTGTQCGLFSSIKFLIIKLNWSAIKTRFVFFCFFFCCRKAKLLRHIIKYNGFVIITLILQKARHPWALPHRPPLLENQYF